MGATKKKRKKIREEGSRHSDILERTPRAERHFNLANLAGNCLSPFVFSSAKKEEVAEEEGGAVERSLNLCVSQPQSGAVNLLSPSKLLNLNSPIPRPLQLTEHK